jgi:hypothetical protein
MIAVALVLVTTGAITSGSFPVAESDHERNL